MLSTPLLPDRPRTEQEGFTLQATTYGLQSTLIIEIRLNHHPELYSSFYPLIKLAEEDWDTDTEYCIVSQQRGLDHSGMGIFVSITWASGK